MKIRNTLGGFALGLAAAITVGAVYTQEAPPPGMDAQAMAMVQSMKAAHDNPTMRARSTRNSSISSATGT